jgi:preprotein translocase subunit SecF
MIRFMRYRLLYFILSIGILLPGTYFFVRSGLRPAIDFTGGTLIEIKLNKAGAGLSEEVVKEVAQNEHIEFGSIQTSGPQSYIIKLKPIEESEKNNFVAKINEKVGETTVLRSETVGPTLGSELLRKTFVASLIAILLILGYVAWAFKNVRYGISAVIALIHDVLMVISVFAILGVTHHVEVDSLFVTALLTTMSFSVHDTIIVFDRIREMERKVGRAHFESMIDTALAETMGRSLNNSFTIVFMLLALVLLGGESIRWFAVALLVGTISGVYSSPFVATPILYQWHVWRDKK